MLFGTRPKNFADRLEEAEAPAGNSIAADASKRTEDDPVQVPRKQVAAVPPSPATGTPSLRDTSADPWKPAVRNAAAVWRTLSEVSVEQLELVSSALKVIRNGQGEKGLATRRDCIVEDLRHHVPSIGVSPGGSAGPRVGNQILRTPAAVSPVQGKSCPSGAGS